MIRNPKPFSHVSGGGNNISSGATSTVAGDSANDASGGSTAATPTATADNRLVMDTMAWDQGDWAE